MLQYHQYITKCQVSISKRKGTIQADKDPLGLAETYYGDARFYNGHPRKGHDKEPPLSGEITIRAKPSLVSLNRWHDWNAWLWKTIIILRCLVREADKKHHLPCSGRHGQLCCVERRKYQKWVSGIQICPPKVQCVIRMYGLNTANQKGRPHPDDIDTWQKMGYGSGNPIPKSTVGLGTRYNAMVSVIDEEETSSPTKMKTNQIPPKYPLLKRAKQKIQVQILLNSKREAKPL